MTSWDIQVAAARGVISTATGHAAEIKAEEPKLSTALTTAAGTSNSTLITGAIADLYDTYLANVLATASVRSANVCTATGDAVAAYQNGDLNMAATANAQAGKAPAVEQ